jgi:diguanylate cyclase (GGDEF)-like protein
MNRYGREIWGDPGDRVCWQVLQSGQTGPCAFCTNHLLVDPDGTSTGTYVWELQNTRTGRWYQCRDEAISWTDGRLVRIEIASDITDRKLVEDELKASQLRAEELARTDDLTGITNRRGFFDDSNKLFSLAKRFDHSTSIVMLDIDYFKEVNDRHGHAMGDQVLVDFVQTIQGHIREVDVFGRLGGEEFALILPETDMTGAINIAEKLRSKISATDHRDGKTSIAISCSFGVTTLSRDHRTFENALSDADRALYLAKTNGRNRVEYYPHSAYIHESAD